MNKKILLLGISIVNLVNVISLSAFLSEGANIAADEQYAFTSYSNNNSNITSNYGSGVAFSPNGDVGYSASSFQGGGGLTIGIENNNSYQFQNYSDISTPNKGIVGNNGAAVAFDKNNDVAYTGSNNGLTIGIYQGDGTYDFQNYNVNNTNGEIVSNIGSDVAFSSDGDIGYIGYQNGLTIGKPDGLGDYTFSNYNYDESTSVNPNSGTRLAFSPRGEVAIASINNGLFVGEPDDSGYNFTNYDSNSAFDSGTGVAFSSNINDPLIGYTASGGALSVGYLDGNSYIFSSYNLSNTSGITSNSGSGVAFDSNNNVVYSCGVDLNTSTGGGISVGIYNSRTGGYNFQAYGTGSNRLPNLTGTDVAINNDGLIAYASYNSNSGGLSIGSGDLGSSLSTRDRLALGIGFGVGIPVALVAVFGAYWAYDKRRARKNYFKL